MWPTTKLRLTAFRFIRFVSVPATECMHRMPFLWLLHAGFYLLICCVQALQHQQASSAFSLGFEIPKHQGTCRSAHHGFTTSISISFRGVLFGLFLSSIFRVGEIIKKRACISSHASETWDYGLNGSSKDYFPQLFPLLLLFTFHVQKSSMLLLLLCHAVNSGWLLLNILGWSRIA